MNTSLEIAIIEQLHHLDEHRKAEVLDFVEYLITKYQSAQKSVARESKPQHNIDPMRYSGTVNWPVDGMTYQKTVREEWE